MTSYRPAGEQLAKDAYAAYGQATDNLNHQGKPMPEWDQLPASIRAAWQLAAEAVRDRVEDCAMSFQTVRAR